MIWVKSPVLQGVGERETQVVWVINYVSYKPSPRIPVKYTERKREREREREICLINRSERETEQERERESRHR